jgi:hypothetical protein
MRLQDLSKQTIIYAESEIKYLYASLKRKRIPFGWRKI